MSKRVVSAILGVLLLIASLAIIISVSLYLAGADGLSELLYKSGAFLYDRFYLAAFYLCVFTAALGYIALAPNFRRRSLLFLLFTLLPFVTAAVIFHVLLNPRPNNFVATLILLFSGRRPAGVVLLLFMLIQLLLSYRYILAQGRIFSGTTSPAQAPKTEHVPNKEDDGLFPLRNHEDPIPDEVGDALSDSEHAEEKEPIEDLHVPDDQEYPFADESLLMRRDTEGRMQFSMLEEEELSLFDDAEEYTRELPDEAPLSPVETSPVKTSAVQTEKAIDDEQDVETREFVPEGEPGSMDSLYVDDLEDPSIRGLVRDILDADEIPEPPESAVLPQPSEGEIPEELDLEEIEDFEEDPLPLAPEAPPEEVGEVKKKSLLEKAPSRQTKKGYSVPVDDLLQRYSDHAYWVVDDETRHAGEILKNTLEEFKIEAEVTGIRKGPVITMFEILPAPGVKLSKITNLADNIALRLAASSVRIVAPIPGKHAVGIEVPNHKRAIVSFHEMISDETFNKKHFEIPVILGKDIAGGTQLVDLINTPHLLIAGATGSGKSVCVNSLICSILCKKTPEEVRMLLIDPKIVELKLYNDIPHLLTPVITEPKRAFQALQYCLSEMEQRYTLLDSLGVRDIRSYNRKVKERRLATKPLPYIVIIVDEFADLMASTGKELESTLARLAAMSRAVGLHLVLATQRPSIDVITGLIKANIPSRIAFMVAGKTDSRIIIDTMGAEKLLGKGDMLFTSAWDPNPVRIQGSFLSEEEVGNIVGHVKTLGEPDYIDDEIFFDDDESVGIYDEGGPDPLMDKALEIVTQAGKASASYLQRRLKIGYNRAARLVEDMEHRGIVGPQNGSKPREILHIPDRVEQTVEY